jgi:hypothetical protein
MKTITKSVIKLSEIPKHLQEIFNGHKIHTYAEFHIDDSEKDDLSLWLIETYHTIKMKISFLIHIDKQQERSYSEDEVLRIIRKCKEYLAFGDEFDEIKWFEQFKKK